MRSGKSWRRGPKLFPKKQDCGVYFALVDDYTEYGNGSVFEVTYQLYHGSELGMGSGRDGIIVLLSMAEQGLRHIRLRRVRRVCL